MPRPPHILGIETSCDETAAAVVVDGREVRSNIILSQIAEHRPYGGVVPEIASRCHVESLPHVMRDAVETAGIDWADIDAVAVTHGPGLASSLLVGLSGARALSMRIDRPLVGVNHLEAHLYSMFLDAETPPDESLFPLVALLVSGGHSCLVRVDGPTTYTLLGQTIDDAAGEALDKGAALLKLGYPGGPVIETTAEGGDPKALELPRRPRIKSTRFTGGLAPELCFSFSGLKTALLYAVKAEKGALDETRKRDICASYQDAVFDALLHGLEKAIERERPKAIACVGGVAKNRTLRGRLDQMAESRGLELRLAPMAYCTDNAAMIAGLAGARGIEAGEMPVDVNPNLSLTKKSD